MPALQAGLAATMWQLMRGSATAMDGGNAGLLASLALRASLRLLLPLVVVQEQKPALSPDCEELILALQLGCLPSMAATLRAITL